MSEQEQARKMDAESYSNGYKAGLNEAMSIFQRQIDAALHSRPIRPD